MKGAIEAHITKGGDPSELGDVIAAVQDAYNGTNTVGEKFAMQFDANGDGKLDPAEKAKHDRFNKVSLYLKNKDRYQISPDDVARLQEELKTLRPVILGPPATA